MSARSREQLAHLLAEAAEFEHNLLCCYLYAAFSLKREPDAGLQASELEIVKRWRAILMSVVMEEMLHLALVSNLLVAIGFRAHFNRPNFPVAPGYHPAGIVVALAPFDLETLQHFIYLERPEGADIAEAPSFAPQVEYARKRSLVDAPLMPGARDFETIAQFYGEIREGFVQLAASLGERELFAGDPASQVGFDAAGIEGLHLTNDLASSLAAIDTIVLQGEGSAGDAEDSHFARFQGMHDEYHACLANNPAFSPAYPSARNPVMRAPWEAGHVHVVAEPAAQLLDLGNALYNHMLRMLSQAYGRADRAPDRKRVLMGAAIDTMHAMADVGEQLARHLANPESTGVTAGISFATLRATEPQVEDEGEWGRIAQRFGELASGMRHACAAAPQLQRNVARLEEQQRVFGSR